MKKTPPLIVCIARFGDERHYQNAELQWIPLTIFTLGIGTVSMLVARKICRNILNYEEHEEKQLHIRQIKLGLRHPYESEHLPVPGEDATEDEVWRYALSFKGYTWATDMRNAGKLEEILTQDERDFLDQHYSKSYTTDWRDPNGTEGAVMLLGCVGCGKEADDCSVDEIRAILFMEQRAQRYHAQWDENDEENWQVGHARDMISAIREKYEKEDKTL